MDKSVHIMSDIVDDRGRVCTELQERLKSKTNVGIGASGDAKLSERVMPWAFLAPCRILVPRVKASFPRQASFPNVLLKDMCTVLERGLLTSIMRLPGIQ